MSTTLNRDQRSIPVANVQTASRRLQQDFAACRLRFRWFGTSKTLSPQQKDRAADTFGAEGKFLSAGKKLIDTQHEAYRNLTSIRTRIIKFWKAGSLPYPESGIRLIRQERIEDYNEQFGQLRHELDEAVRQLESRFGELKAMARRRLGSLFSEADYPDSLHDLFGVEWEFPSVEVPDYLRELNPALYEEQSRRVTQRFEQAVQMAEQAFLEELDRLVSHLAERLAGTEDGKPKIFRDSALENLDEFFRRFRQLNIRSNEQLDELVDRCERVVHGFTPQQVRENETLRETVRSRLAGVQSNLDQLLVDRPRRNILRPSRTSGETSS